LVFYPEILFFFGIKFLFLILKKKLHNFMGKLKNEKIFKKGLNLKPNGLGVGFFLFFFGFFFSF
jgi:hypothetical protein